MVTFFAFLIFSELDVSYQYFKMTKKVFLKIRKKVFYDLFLVAGKMACFVYVVLVDLRCLCVARVN